MKIARIIEAARLKCSTLFVVHDTKLILCLYTCIDWMLFFNWIKFNMNWQCYAAWNIENCALEDQSGKCRCHDILIECFIAARAAFFLHSTKNGAWRRKWGQIGNSYFFEKFSFLQDATVIYLQEIDRLVGQTYTVVPRFSLSRFNGLSQFSASDRAWSHF